MQHPDLRQALAIAHIEDLRREAARRQTIRLARRVAKEPHVGAPSIAGPSAAHDERPSSLIQTFLRLGVARARRLQVRIR